MNRPIDFITSKLKNDHISELEKLVGFSPKASDGKGKGEDKIAATAASIVGQRSGADKKPIKHEEDKYWEYYKVFGQTYERYKRQFAFFVGDILDIMLTGTLQSKLVKEMMEEKLANIRKASEAAALEEAIKRKHHVQRKKPVEYEVEVGGEKRVFVHHFIKRKYFLAALFVESEEYPNYKKVVKLIEEACEELVEDGCLNSSEERKAKLGSIVSELKYEVSQRDLLYIWKLLAADNFEHLEWIYNECKDLYLLRSTFYEDLDDAYQVGKKLLKLLMNDTRDEFPPAAEKKDIYVSYLRDILAIYMYHHFVIKHFKHHKEKVTVKDYDELKTETTERISALRSETEALRGKNTEQQNQLDDYVSQIRALKAENDELNRKLARLDPNEVRRQLQAAEAKANAADKRLQEALTEEAELRTGLRELDKEVQELTQRLRDLNAIPDETAYSVENLLNGKRIAIFGGISRDHYLNLLKEAGVENEDYEWYEGYHTISLARTAEIVGRVDIAVVVTSYAGHLMLYQVRPCIKPHQHFFKIHNSGAGSLRKEILNTFKGKKS